MHNRLPHGVVPPLVTPFKENERIDYGALQTAIDLLIGAGVHGLMVGGSQGEFYALDMEERTVAMRFARQAVAGRVPLFVNVGAITTRDTVALALQAQALDVDAVAVVTPYYVMPTQDELVEHFVEVSNAVRLPVLAYNFPAHGGVQLSAAAAGRIARKCPNLAGVIDAVGSAEQAASWRDAAPDREFRVFTFDHRLLAALDGGCAGTVAAAANLAPRLFLSLYGAFRAGDRAEAERLQALVAELGSATAAHTFPAVVKEALNTIGIPVGPCRRPVGQMPEEARRKLAEVVELLRREGMLLTAASGARA